MPTLPPIQPVVLAGGYGTRLWPLSRQLLPKQFLPLVSERSMLQEAVLRAFDPDTGALVGASDIRKDGLAIGY